ncbi:MAG TPA: hypothetical protein PK760_14400, partial [Flavobacteriales bacterium]|nr:hypothetical protein [Flavobacteriales bacterium]
HLRLGDAQKAVELIPMIERGLKKHDGSISTLRLAAFNYQIAYAHVINNDPEKALRSLNKLLNDVRSEDASDAVCFGRLLQLLLLLEMGKADVLRFTLRNTERFLRLHARKHRFEPVLLQLVRDLSKKNCDTTTLLEQFRMKAEAMENDPLERMVFDHFDPIAWAESKLGGGSFAERIRLRMRAMEHAA